MKNLTINLAGLVLAASSTSFAVAGEPEKLPHAFEAGWKGAKTCEVLYETAEVRVGKCSFPPGVGHEKHYHNPHFGYVIEGGKMLVRNDKGESEVETVSGSTWSTTQLSVHEAVNIGETTASYLVVEPKNPDSASQ